MPDRDVEERARARVGEVIHGKYRLDRLLGIGGMAAVYAATHRNTKRVAVKMLHRELSVNAGLRTRFMREGYVANTVDHPGAVAVSDDDVAEDGSAFLVMELLEGATLDELAERHEGRLPARAVLSAAHQLLDVLAAADAKSIVHRDIKPANVFVTRAGQVKVLDFGVARLRDAEGGGATHSGMALGTPAFMAPEQALGRPGEISGRTDVWAVGATMLALLTGRLVHEASSAQEQMVFAATRRAPSLATFEPGTPASIVALVDRALAFDQAERWHSAAAMRDAVRDVHQEIFGAPPSAADLAPLAAEGGAPAVDAMPSDPFATTVAVPSNSTGPRAPSVDPVVSPKATSLAGTTAQTPPAPKPAGRARFAIGALVLVVGGAAAGAWAVSRGASRPVTPPASTTTSTDSVPAFAPPSSTPAASVASAAPSTSVAPAMSSSPPSPAAATTPAPVRPARPVPAAPRPTSDKFDRQ